MIVSRLDRVSRHYSTDTIFQDLSCQIELGDRIGLVGPNGAGKTTMLRLIAGEDPPDTGSVYRHPSASVAYLKQTRQFSPGKSLFEEARIALHHLEVAYEELIEAGRRMAEADTDQDRISAARTYEDRQEFLRRHGGYDFEHRIEEVLFGLGFQKEQFDREISTFSGGQQSRALLARLLLQSPDLMLLDEPTNHLDIETVEWLEGYLLRQQIAILVVSHDRYFLDKVTSKIFELQAGKLTVYSGNYSHYRELRAERQKVNERLASRKQEEIARLDEFVRKNKAGQLSKQAKSREKMIARLAGNEIERIVDVRGPMMSFGEASRTGDIVMQARDVSKSYSRLLFSGVNVEIERGARVGIIGPNGAGKTTLLRILLEEEPPTSGKARLGHNVRLGYLRQEVDDLDPDAICLDAVRPAWKAAEKEESFRALLARFGIGSDLAENRVRSLSGGQRTRVALARIAACDVNLLVLDEPTNHLDLWAVDSLEDALTEFDGTIVVVSHDRAFLSAVCERLLVIENQTVRMTAGSYERYVEEKQRKAAELAEAARKGQKAQTNKTEATKPKRKRKFPYRKAEEIERDIADHEKQVAELETRIQSPEVYTDGKRLHELSRELDTVKAELERLMEHWSEAMELNT